MLTDLQPNRTAKLAQKRSSPQHLLSKLLSAADSLEMLSQSQSQRRSTMTAQTSTVSETDTEWPTARVEVLAAEFDAPARRSDTDVLHAQTQCDLQAVPVPMSKRRTVGSKRRTFSSPFIDLRGDEYVRSLQSVPVYMRADSGRVAAAANAASIWDYRVTSDAEWTALLAKVDALAEHGDKRVRMADKMTMTSTAAAAADSLMACEGRPSEKKLGKAILRLDRRTDGRWNGLTVAKLLTRMEEDADILRLMEKTIVV